MTKIIVKNMICNLTHRNVLYLNALLPRTATMRTSQSWSDTVPDHEGQRQVVWDLCFKPDGSQLVAAVGKRLVIYDAVSGEVLQQRTAHQGDIYSVSVSKDGQFIATGSSDKQVSVWTFELAEKYKFTHVESVQAVCFNPVMPNVLASASSRDFAIWPMPSSSLRKIKLPSKALCAAWTGDGQYLAIGMLSGSVSVRDSTGAEKLVLDRPGPIWDLTFTPSRTESDPYDMLTVACWDGTLSFYSLTGQSLGPDRIVGAEQCTIRFLSGGEFLIAGGADRKATLYTRDGACIGPVMEGKDWIWRAAVRPRTTSIAVACNDGTISMHNVSFSTVHGLYGERYAYREAMTDVVVQHLLTDSRVRIKCKDYVKKLAVYRDRLAVQLSDRIVVYELLPDGEVHVDEDNFSLAIESSMTYRVKDRINAALECNLLVVTSQHVVLCLEKRLQSYSVDGKKDREWVLDAVIRYIKVVGGPSGREGLLVGLKNGAICRIFLDNPFPVQLVKHKSSIRCLDLSASRRRLALVDDTSTVVVYDITTGGQLWAESGANSVAWNSMNEGMLCFSGNGMLSIKTGHYPLHTQKLSGFVVGFSGSKIFCLHSVSMQTVDVPHSSSLARFVEDKDWDVAYRTACLGVTHSDWAGLGQSALSSLNLKVARAALSRAADTRNLELVDFIDTAKRGGKANDASLVAEVYAYAGKYAEAARLHLQGGTVDRAVEMLTDLRLWDQARRFAEESGRVDVASLLLKQAAWCEDAGEISAAATIYSGLGQASKAVSLLAERRMDNELLYLVRSMPGDQIGPASQMLVSGVDLASEPQSSNAGLTADIKEALTAAGAYFRQAGSAASAREAYLKLGDVEAMLQLLIDAGAWDEALELAVQAEAQAKRRLISGAGKTDGGSDGGIGRATSKLLSRITDNRSREVSIARALVSQVHVAHAEALALDDRFEEAQKCYGAAGRPDLASSLTQHLVDNAVAEDRWEDAALHCHRLSLDTATALEEMLRRSDEALPSVVSALCSIYRRYRHDADVYHAYAFVHQYITAPFTTAPPNVVFYASCVILNMCLGPLPSGTPVIAGGRLPYAVSLMKVIWALARQAAALEAWRMARFALDRLAELLVPHSWREQIDMAILSAQTKPSRDKDGLAMACPRCAVPCPLIAVPVAALNAAPVPSPCVPANKPGRNQDSTKDLARCASVRDAAFAGQAASGDCCPSCRHGIVRSAQTFEPLPLVECTPDDKALSADFDLLLTIIGSGENSALPKAVQGGRQVLDLADTSRGPLSLNKGLQDLMAVAQETAATAMANNNAVPVVPVGTSILRRLKHSDVFVVRPVGYALAAQSGATPRPSALPLIEKWIGPRLFVNVQPSVSVSMCSACCRFFHSEDLEYDILQKGGCPFCRAPQAVVYAP